MRVQSPNGHHDLRTNADHAVTRLQSFPCGRTASGDIGNGHAITVAGSAAGSQAQWPDGLSLCCSIISVTISDDLVDRDRERDLLGADTRTATFTPMISPSMFNSGPPELPGIDSGTDLDQVLVVLCLVDRDVAMEGADDSLRAGVDITKRIADRDDAFANHQDHC